MSVEDFQEIARIAQDKAFEVRDKVLRTLHDGAKDVQHLSIRFLALFVLYATDPEKELLMKV